MLKFFVCLHTGLYILRFVIPSIVTSAKALDFCNELADSCRWFSSAGYRSKERGHSVGHQMYMLSLPLRYLLAYRICGGVVNLLCVLTVYVGVRMCATAYD